MKKCRYTDRYSVQVRTSVFTCLLSCLLGLGQVAYGIWLVLHNLQIAGLIGKTLLNVTWAVSGCGGYASIIALIGVVAYTLRRRSLVILHLFLTLLSIVSLGVVWTIIYIEQRRVAEQMPTRLQLPENTKHYHFIDYQYNCNLNATAEPQRYEFQQCARFLTRQTWIQVYALLGMCGALICVQSVLVLMGGMMSKLLKHVEQKTHPIRATNPLITHVNPRTSIIEEDLQGEASMERTRVQSPMERTHVQPPMERTDIQPSAPHREFLSSPSPITPSALHVTSPPFNPRDGFALSYSNPNVGHPHRQRQQSITQL